MNKKIYGAIGYVILSNSDIFKNTKILIISDNHDENIDMCNSEQITIDKYLKLYLKKKYKIFLEEIPVKIDYNIKLDLVNNNKKLQGLFPNSQHIINLRKLYLDNINNINNIIATDIRLELFDYDSFENISTENYIKYYYKIYNFLTQNNDIFINISKKYYFNILYDLIFLLDLFENFKFNKKKIMFQTLNLLDKIMEFYTFCLVCLELEQNINKNIIINCGLFHSENLIKMFKKILNYKIIHKHGVNKMIYASELDNICIDFIDF